jgi:5-formyltetrahydrofolate cyclo-ligase
VSTASKTQLFNRMMSTRDELEPEFVNSAGLEIQRRVLLMEEFRTALRIGLYLPWGNEVRTDMIFREGDRHRKEIYSPAMDAESGELAYFRTLDAEDVLRASEGIRLPAGKRSRLRELNTLHVLIVPGVAFDLRGGRMGMGGGFYSGCLKGFRGHRIAFGYDFQVVAHLPRGVNKHDVDWIVTEKRLIRCQRR